MLLARNQIILKKALRGKWLDKLNETGSDLKKISETLTSDSAIKQSLESSVTKRFTKPENKDIEQYFKLYIQRHETPSLRHSFLYIRNLLKLTFCIGTCTTSNSINTCATCLATTSKAGESKDVLGYKVGQPTGNAIVDFHSTSSW